MFLYVDSYSSYVVLFCSDMSTPFCEVFSNFNLFQSAQQAGEHVGPAEGEHVGPAVLEAGSKDPGGQGNPLKGQFTHQTYGLNRQQMVP